MVIFLKILFLILAYLIGSVPFGLIISKLKNQDLREKGSCNIGAANAGRVLGKSYAALTFALDMFKGALFVILFRYKIIPSTYMVLSPSLYGFFACLGHCFPIYLKFKGGKGVATGAGCIFGYFPLLSIIALGVFFIVVRITKIAALGSLISGFILTIISIILSLIEVNHGVEKLVFTSLIEELRKEFTELYNYQNKIYITKYETDKFITIS